MTAETLTWISGVVLLMLLVVVWWFRGRGA